MENFAASLQLIVQGIKHNAIFLAIILACIWSLQLINCVTNYRLNSLGILPRYRRGLVGIVFAPLLHGNFSHLFFNSIPWVVLANFILLQSRTIFVIVTLSIMLISGILIWLFARPAYHIGASALVMGYWSYLLIHVIYHPDVLGVILAIVCIYYFGGLVLNLFPQDIKTSWEGHVMGFIAGIATAYLIPFIAAVM